MRRFLSVIVFLSCLIGVARADSLVVQTCGVAPKAYAVGSTRYDTVDVNGNKCISGLGAAGYPAGATAIAGNATGSTSAVVGTLTSAAGQTAYLCGFNVSVIGGTAAINPVVAGIVGGPQTYQMLSAATPILLSQSFSPCLPASAVNTNITVTTTADGTATAVDVNSWGYLR